MTALYRHPLSLLELDSPSIVAIGNFDGVHRGHTLILERLKNIKNNWDESEKAKTILVSFYPHPALVLGKERHVHFLSTLRQKIDLLSRFDIDILYMIRFTRDFAEIRAEEFIENYLIKFLKAQHVVLGPDTAVGVRRAGGAEFICDYMYASGRKAEIVPFLKEDAEKISSKDIRYFVQEARFNKVRKFLGRNYSICTKVIRGERRGTLIGYPTANLLSNGQVVPRRGVYATRAMIENTTYDSVTNVGVCPTFFGQEERIEVHLLISHNIDCYGKRIELEFVEHLRDEIRYEKVEDLRVQIAKDIEETKKILGVQ